MSKFYYEGNKVLNDHGWDLEVRKRGPWLWLGVLGLLVLAVVGYFSYDKVQLNRQKAATVWVISDFGQGSGFFINAEGRLLTNRHVVVDENDRKSKTLTVWVNSGTEGAQAYQARFTDHMGSEVTKGRVTNDWALLQLEETPARPLKYLRLNAEQELSETFKVRALGYPDGDRRAVGPQGPKVTVKEGTITRVDTEKEKVLHLASSVGLVEGMSGGPLIYRGRVVGINTAGLDARDNEDYSLPVSTLPPELTERYR